MKNGKVNILFIGLVFALLVPFIHAWNSEAIPQGTTAGDQENLRTLLPEDGDMTGWKIEPGSKIFKPEDLWEQINGQAEFYLDYGFERLITADYAPLDRSHFITIEIYRMESPDHAFGIYAAERSPDEKFLKGKIQGYAGKNFLNFWKGPCYVKLAAIQNDSDTSETLLKLSEIIGQKIGGTAGEPALFACFPEKNRVKMRERFIPKNFLGQPYMKNGYRVDYARGGFTYQLFLIRNVSREEAGKVFEKYQHFLMSRKAVLLPIERPGYQEFAVKGKNEYIFQYDSFVGGILNAADLNEAGTIIEEIVLRLKKL